MHHGKVSNKVTDTTFLPGDQILLKSGSVWNGEWLWPKGSGVEGAPIIIDKYGGEEKPIINGMGIDRGLNYSGSGPSEKSGVLGNQKSGNYK